MRIANPIRNENTITLYGYAWMMYNEPANPSRFTDNVVELEP